MMDNELISIVVPVYNVEDYLPCCLDSIIRQTYTNIEIVLVDDGTPDRSGVICDKYAQQDRRIKVFHIPNGGVAKARQFGVENSTGEYIVFVDPDDWMTLDAVESMYKHMGDDISIVVSSYVRVFKGKEAKYISSYEICNQDEYIKLLLGYKILVTPWAKLYRRNLFVDDSFPSYRQSQDMLMNIRMGLSVNKVKFVEDITYYYLYSRPDSTSNKLTLSFEVKKDMIEYVYSKFKSYKSENKYELHLALFSLCYLFTDVRDGRLVDTDDSLVKETLATLKKYKLSLTHTIMIVVLKCIFLQKCYFLFRNMIASNMHIRKIMAKMR